ncbi:hypothetical protein DFJ77DRAFT_456091 [Powellomyces hirtus]|nr:hypothetical protein DFJ77DRAFT_456091 [Powellomyces hirtus]
MSSNPNSRGEKRKRNPESLSVRDDDREGRAFKAEKNSTAASSRSASGELSSSKRLRVPDGHADELDETKQLKMELLSAKNAFLKAKLDCEQLKRSNSEQEKIIENMSAQLEKLKSQILSEASAQELVSQLRRELKEEKDTRQQELRQMSHLIQLLRQIEEASPAHQKADLDVKNMLAGKKQSASHNSHSYTTKPSSLHLESHRKPSTQGIQLAPNPSDYNKHTRDPDLSRARRYSTQRKPSTRPEIEEDDPNASAIIPVDEEMLRKAEEEKKIEAMLKVEIPPEALAEVTKQPGMREDFPVDTSDAKPSLRPLPDKKKPSESKWHTDHRSLARTNSAREGILVPTSVGGSMGMHHPAPRYCQTFSQFEMDEARAQAGIYHNFDGRPPEMGFYPVVDHVERMGETAIMPAHHNGQAEPPAQPVTEHKRAYDHMNANEKSNWLKDKPAHSSSAPYQNGVSSHASGNVSPIKHEPRAPAKEITLEKATAMLHTQDPETGVETKQCDQGTIAVKRFPDQPNTARIVMYDDWNDVKVMNLPLSSKVTVKRDHSDIVITLDEMTRKIYVVTLLSPRHASDMFDAIHDAMAHKPTQHKTNGLGSFLKAYTIKSE